MALTVHKHSKAPRFVAPHDLYLDKDRSRVIVVKEGEDVPADAAFVLSGKGGQVEERFLSLVPDEVREIQVPPEPPAAPPSPDSGFAEPEVLPEAEALPEAEVSPEPQVEVEDDKPRRGRRK